MPTTALRRSRFGPVRCAESAGFLTVGNIDLHAEDIRKQLRQHGAR